ncbi:Acetyl-CoA synthetase-like protein [Glarea lozoyensis ATCC 20868]|uniref:Nonribosomal peptide synthetase gloA n=1 Tax=Glarea lozoyensis (strain ATCC 20868 / MF5171) TaxID=1116229 RepID=GLOA_GLAL2|nr:Acetyl-CoA synthetase-like protein [Glarea lozoyensis ATCC 20868]S3DQP3.1 RecName: Full=Nonribosomal peptide synthetase gloA; AltName: Full=Pneumocandin biosynthesis cluster protein A [Glarea lozoyensis ATCC 20868]EPE34341.1 Acetyl-CoA synthetase-like protein [Glarea lozoyensis ATCC 20868]
MTPSRSLENGEKQMNWNESPQTASPKNVLRDSNSNGNYVNGHGTNINGDGSDGVGNGINANGSATKINGNGTYTNGNGAHTNGNGVHTNGHGISLESQTSDSKVHSTSKFKEEFRAICAKVLKIDIEELDDTCSFVSLGGDSISAIKLVTECEVRGIELKTVDVISTHTISGLFATANFRPFGKHSNGKTGISYSRNQEDDDPSPFALWTAHRDSDLIEKRQRLEEIAVLCGVETEEIEDVYPCTPLQEGLIAITTRQPTAYVQRRVCRLTNEIDLERFWAAWETLVANVASLRTRIIMGPGGQSLQVVIREKLLWRRGSNLGRYLSRDRADGMMLGQPLARFGRIQEETGSFFVWTAHHSIFDGWSALLLYRQLLAIYQQSYVPRLVPFSRFLRYLAEQDSTAATRYWHSQLHGDTMADWPALPSSNYQPQPQHVFRSSINLPHGYKPGTIMISNLLRAAWALVMAQYSGNDDVIFAVTVSGRSAPVSQIADIIAPTITTVPVRIRIDRSMSIAELLLEIQSQAAKMIEHEHTGLQTIKKLLPEFGTALELRNLLIVQPEAESDDYVYKEFPGLEAIREAMEDFDNYGLNVECILGSQSIEVLVNYDDHVINTMHLRDVMGQFTYTVQCLCNPSVSKLSVNDVATIKTSDQQRILEWNEHIPPSVDRCIHHLVQDQVNIQPAKLAVDAWDGKYTYADLARESISLAHHLVGLGLGPEQPVGLCGSVLPLGVSHPFARTSGIVQEAKVRIVLVDESQRTELAKLATTLIVVDSELIAALPSEAKPPETGVTPENVAWILFTSGSTGTPKGVVLQHASLCTSLIGHANTVGINKYTRTFQFAAFTFDVSLCDIFSTLQAGGCVCMPSEDERMNSLAEAASRMEVNYAELTSTVTETISPSQVPSLATLALSGEALKPSVLSTWARHSSVFNSYGPTECSIVASNSKRLSNVEEAQNIGGPMSSIFWVVQAANFHQLCPIGAPGELLIEGPLLARGYLNDEVKTEKAFIIDPDFTKQLGLSPGRRMYRTGDLVRQNQDGSLMYLGRCDSTQVKVRGQRVEVSEIEYQISRQLPEIQTVAVEMLQRGTQASLVAVVNFAMDSKYAAPAAFDTTTTKTETIFSTDALRAVFQDLQLALSQVLPAYMIPTLYAPMSTIPMNASGKLDRRVLRTKLDSMSFDELRVYMADDGPKAAPSTDAEKQVQSLWSEVLAINPQDIALSDNFFRIGGDSIAAMRMVALKASRRLRLTVADVFQHPQLSDLAFVIQRRLQMVEDGVQEEDSAPFDLWAKFKVDGLDSTKRAQELAIIATRCDIRVDDIEDIYPCTPLQEGLIAITTHQPTAYVSRQIYKLAPTLDVVRFQKAWQTLAQVTPILRTRILAGLDTSDVSLQVVVRGSITWQYGADSGTLSDYVAQDRKSGMRLGQPLVRFGLVRNSSEQFFIWTAHHSVYDGWSVSLMYQHLYDIYFDQRIPSTIPYARFIRYLIRHDDAASEKYWRSQLQGEVVSNWPPLPRADYQPRPQQRYTCDIILPDHTMNDRVNSLLPSVLRAAWGVTMSKYTGQGDVVFGVTLLGRNAPVSQITEMTGPTITTVPVRIHLDGPQPLTINQFLQNVQKQAADMINYEHAGLQVIKKLVPELNSSLELRNLLVIQPASETDGTAFPGLDPLPVDLEGFDSYGLTIECSILSGLVKVEARYDENVIATPQLKRTIRTFEHVVKQLLDVRNSVYRLEEMSWLSDYDEEAIANWSKATPIRVERCIHELVQEQTKLRPNATAICAWDGNLTYAELDMQATWLARYLTSLGACSQRMVGICMDKSKWAGVSMLAVLKAGAVLVPLGVNHPEARIKAMVDDTDTQIILVDEKQRDRLSIQGVRLITVDADILKKLPVLAEKEELLGSVNPDDAAWVIYTSGSTGKPKGVVLQHVALCSSIQAHGARFGMGTSTRMLQFAAHTFDACIQDYFTTLSWGGVVCVPSENDRMSDLTTAMCQMKVTFATLTSTVARLIDPHKVPSMQKLALVGEPVKADVVKQWLGHTIVLNAYGPSECSIHSSCGEPLADSTKSAVIGTGMGTRLWVVDVDYNQLCPIGAPGELLIEGPLLAREYLNDPRKTKAAFVSDPRFAQKFGLAPGTRMYRTGDLVKQNEDSSITHLGRRDTQIKIRGQRVEVGEIEFQIAQHPQVRTVAVELLEQDSNGSQVILTAVIEFTEDSEYRNGPVTSSGLLTLTPSLSLAFEMLRGALFQVLPSYMLPSMYVPIVDMPMNVNGKLDRRAVRDLLQAMTPDVRQQYLSASDHKVAPSTREECLVHSLWTEALSLSFSQVGIYDNFFQIGGDSVVAMRMVATESARELQLTVADLFQHPRLIELAELLAKRSVDKKVEADPEPFSLWLEPQIGSEQQQEKLTMVAKQCGISVNHVEDVYPCTPLQVGLMAITARQPLAYIDRQVYKLADTIDLDRFQAAWRALSDATPILRTRIITSEGPQSFLQVVVGGCDPWRDSNDLEDYMASDRDVGIALGKPLVRMGLVRERNSEERYFVWTAHHSVYDGTSALLMYQQLASIYFHGSLLPTAPFTRFIRYLARKEVIAAESAAYWADQLQGEVMANWPPLPRIDYQPKPQHEMTQIFRLPQFESRSVVTISNVIRAAWALVMAQRTGHSDVVFAVTVSGRNAPISQVDSIIAPTISTVPVRVQIDWTQDVAGFLFAIQNQAAQMIDYEHTGLRAIKALVPELGPTLDIRNVLVVQTAEERGAADHFPGIEALPQGKENFDSYGLLTECTLGTDGEVRIDFRYDDNVIPSSSIKRISAQFAHLVQQLCGNATSTLHRLNELVLIAPEDQEQIMKWNPMLPPRVDSCIHELFYKQVMARPQAEAVSGWDGELSYSDLADESIRLAYQLISLGIGPEMKVGLCIDKSKWAIIAIMSILFAGGVVVPLGVTHPLPRLDVVIEDASIDLILVDQHQRKRLAALSQNVKLITVNDALLRTLPVHTEPPVTGVVSRNAAWIIYTSGSTGTPKGVVLEHGGCCTSMRTQGKKMNLSAETRALQFTPFTFDVSISDVSATLIYGGCICVISESDRVNNLPGAIREMKVNFASLTPTVAQMLSPAELPSLKTLALTGEAVKPEVVELWMNSVALYDTYGPSEGSVCTCNGPLSSPDQADNIGFPMSTLHWVTQLHNHNQLCPIGAPGELLIEGPLLARGYLNQARTKESFVNDPAFTKQQTGLPSARHIYRTGDLVRQNEDGSFIYLGRRDDQIKIRGQRVEVGEIEYQIVCELPGTHSAAVAMLQDGKNISLIAIVDFKSDSEHYPGELESLGTLAPTPQLRAAFNELRQSLTKLLPSYMVPAIFVPVVQMPTNISGKLDRLGVRALLRAIPSDHLARYMIDETLPSETPSTKMEKVIQSLWAEALDIPMDNISAHDNFFQIGGDSVTAMRIVAATTRTNQLQLTVSDIFQNPKLSDLASVMTEHRKNHFDVMDEDPEPFSLWEAVISDNSNEQKRQIEAIAQQCNVSVDDIEDIYPCTALQEGLLAVTARQTSAYVSRQAYVLSDQIDISRFKEAWRKLVAGIHILRTRAVVGPDSLLQVVVRDEITWRHGSNLEDYIQQDKEEGIRLGQPLSRYGLVQLPSGEQVFVWTAHHSIYDGWTIRLMCRQLISLYRQEEDISTSIPYSRFIQYLTQINIEDSIEYWREQLRGESVTANWPSLPQPNYEPRPRHLLRKHISLPRTENQGIVMSNILRAAWGLVMIQYSGENDVVYAANLSGRNVPVRDVAEICAPTITTVPIRLRLDHTSTQTVGDFLQNIQQQAIEMINHEHTGLQVIKSLAPELSDSVLKLRNLLVIQPAAESDTHLDFPGIELVPSDIADFDAYGVNIECTLGQEIAVEARYDENVVETPYMNGVLDQFVYIVGLLCDPSISRWNATVPERVTKCIHELVQEQALARPTALAVQAWDGKLTYGELDNLANRLAHQLVSFGIGSLPDQMVGVCMEKSLFAVVAMLAVLKAGGVVVPLGVTHPITRLDTIIHDTGITVLLVDASQDERLAELSPTRILVNSDHLYHYLPARTQPPKTPVNHMDAAWVIYTSGTTGTPKGAVSEHGTLSTSIKAHGARYGFGHHTRKLNYAAHTFDGTIEDFFTTLSWGGVCCIPSEEDRMDKYKLMEFMNLTKVNSAAMTYTVASLLSPRDLPTLHTLVLGGEPATIDVVSTWMTEVNLFNCYGPSECSIFSAAAGPTKNTNELHNIGFPIGTRLWVADIENYHKLAPIGAPGELLIEGPQLARGYLNDESKTSAAFIVDPAFTTHFKLPLGTRMYRSGDIVRQKNDGSLVYVARRDMQVKIRGQRVEIGEIESQISQHISEARTIAVELLKLGTQSQPVLVAAVEFADGSQYHTGDVTSFGMLAPTEAIREAFIKLRGTLFQVLPGYMVPSAYLTIAEMPRNISGKLDRKTLRTMLEAIPADAIQQYLDGEAKTLPSTQVELQLQALWAEALGISVDGVGAHDNFFQLGGDSVAAMRIVAMSQAREMGLSVADIFAYPRLSELAVILDGRKNSNEVFYSDPEPFALWPRATNKVLDENTLLADIASKCNVTVNQIEDIYPCTPLQEGMIAITARQSAAYVSRQIYALDTTVIELGKFQRAWQVLANATPILRTRLVITQNGQSMQVVLRDTIAWRHSTDLDAYVNEDRAEGISLGQPLLRYSLVKQITGECFFVWTAHHSIYDGWTMRSICQRLVEMYNNIDNSSYQMPQSVPYSRFIHYLTQSDKSAAATFWRQQLHGDIMADWPSLPSIDYQPKPQHRDRKTIRVAGSTSKNILTSNILRAAWALLMSQYTGHPDVVFAASVSGRNAPVWQIGEIAGPTLTTVPVRVQAKPGMTVRQFIQEVQEQSTAMIRFEHTGLQNIKALVPEAAMALELRNVLVVQIAEESDHRIDFPGLEALPMPFEDFDSFGIHLECTPGLDDIEVEARYDVNIVSAPHMKRVLNQFEYVVQKFHDSEYSDFSLQSIQLNPHDERQILEWNATVPSHTERCVHNLVDDHVAARPMAPAICGWDGDLTYRELSRIATSLAFHLQHELGVGPEQKVGVCMDKSKWAVVAMLAVMYAGGVVVPLGVAHPLTRIRGILIDSASSVVLVDATQRERLVDLHTSLICVDAKLIARLSSQNQKQNQTQKLQVEVTPGNLAWVVYTSGSTGKPKGVMLEHRALSTALQAHGSAFGMDTNTRTIQFAAHTFDAAIQDIFTTFSKGGCVCIPSEHDRVNNLTKAMASMNVNFANFTSTVASMLVPEELPSLKTMILAGEAVTPTAVGLWSQHVTIFNSYGPSECSINSSCSKPVKEVSQASNVGLPLSCCFWVTNTTDYNSLCPIGAPGELLIEGPIQARGYLNDKEQTNKSFVTDPGFTKKLGLSGRRMYRTGDLVRQNADGTLTYLGRQDLQVKIRGQRVEIGEIEYQIKKKLLGARTVAVEKIEQGGHSEQTRLVTMMDFKDTSEHSHNPDILASGALSPTPKLQTAFEKLRQSLSEVLPSYMVPTFYVPVAQMPVNASNKLDRRAVKAVLASLTPDALQQYLPGGTDTKQAPDTDLGRLIQGLWADALGISTDTISMTDNIFHLGGDSVTAMRIVAAAYSHELQLTVTDIFQHPQLADLVNTLSNRSLERNTEIQEDPMAFELWEEAASCSTEERKRLLTEVAAQCGVAVSHIEDVYPSTPLQEGLMAITARQPAAYVSRQVYTLAKTVDQLKFKMAWQALSSEAHILRTRLLVAPHGLQVVVNDRIDWHHGTDLENYLQADRRAGMSPGKPLVRYGLIKQPSGETFFVWTSHHSLYDGWTLRSLGKRLLDLYNDGSPQSFVPFSRFIRYLQFGRPGNDDTATYWRNELEGDIVTDWPSLPRSDYQPLPRDNFSRAITLPDSHHSGSVVMSNVIRAAWALVMSQYAGHNDVAFAATVSGRNAPVWQIEDIPAPTITTVPLRISVDPMQTVAEFLDTVQQQAVRMIDYEHTGLQGIKALAPDLGPAIDLRNLLVVQPAADSDSNVQLDFPGLGSVSMPIEPFNSYGLTVECKLASHEIVVDVHYDKDVISSAQLKRVIDFFACVVQRILTQSPRSYRIQEIVAIGEEDLQQVLAWNSTIPPNVDKCIHEMVQAQVKKSPAALAISAWDGDLTYEEFFKSSARLAHHLVALGVNTGSNIGICMDKSKWGPVSMLSIMQAGAAIMPLGTSHPLARIETIVRNSEASVIIVDEKQRQRLDQLYTETSLTLVTVDSKFFKQLPAQTKAPSTGVRPSDASWLIHTSGSTGVPKGVIIDHVTMSTSLRAQGSWLGLNQKSRFLQFSNYTFDNVITDTFATTVFGGCVCVPSEDARMNNLPGFMATANVNVAMLTSTVARQISPSQVPSLHTLILTGEPVRADVVSTWLGHADIYNAYGPTEGSMSTCTKPMMRSDQVSNIGYPLATRAWITQPDHIQLSPIGAPGELFIEGPLLARGYLNNPEMTRDSFIINPEFTKRLGLENRRVYRTGDLVRQNEDGSLIYLGRRDLQVKIRGQRVEVGEIELQIIKHTPGAELVAVELIQQKDTKEEKRNLIAAIEFAKDSEHCHGSQNTPGPQILAPTDALRDDFARLRGLLYQVLPSYMIPSAFIPTTNLDRNLSGKLDRKGLRGLLEALSSQQLRQYSASGGSKVNPSTTMERQLQTLWAEALGIPADQVGAHDNFFQIGGDSMVAMRVVAASHSKDLNLRVNDIFQHSCLSDLAVVLTDRLAHNFNGGQDGHAPFSLIKTDDIDDFLQQIASSVVGCAIQDIVDILPTTDFQSSIIDTALAAPKSGTSHFLLDGNGPCDTRALKKSCLELIQATDTLRTGYVFDQGNLLQVIQAYFEPEIKIYETDSTIEAVTEDIVSRDMYQPIGLGRPFTQIAIIRETATLKHRVLLRLTHAEYDAHSMGSIWQNLRSLYEGGSTRPQAKFSDFLYNQRQSINADTYDYWRDLLKGSSMPAINLSAKKIGQYPSKVNQDLFRTIETPDLMVEGRTSAMLVKSAWSLVLSQFLRVNDVVFADTVSTRTTVDSSLMDAMGCCVTLIPFRVTLEQQWTIKDLLDNVRDQQSQSMQHSQLGFREILRECTDWPASTRFTSALNHISSGPESSIFSMRGVEYSISEMEIKDPLWEIDVGITTIQRGSELEIRLSYLPANISESVATSLLDALHNTLQFIHNNPLSPVKQVLSFHTDMKIQNGSSN